MSEFQVYKAQVLADYDQKKALTQLRLVMNGPTAADLRNEWLRLCEKNFDEQCKKVLDLFFNEQDGFTEYRRVIRKDGADKCRPLWAFLRDRSIDTAERNIELLSYLIDFQPRPYALWQKDPERHNRKIDVVIDETTVRPLEKFAQVTTDWKHKSLTITTLVTILLLCSGVWYMMGVSRAGGGSVENVDALKSAAFKKKNAACMVWMTDHYNTVPCDQANDSSLVVPLDSDRLAHLKRLASTERITMSDTGHIWYFKLNGRLELFTAPGPYPPDTSRRLLPLTAYMYNKYLRHNLPAGNEQQIR